jgi:hypothetical protein
MLSQRLGELTDAGIATRTRRPGHRGYVYALTDAGRELDDIINLMAVWGQHWARDMEMDDLDPGFLAWSMHLRLNTAEMPPGRTVLQFEFSGAPADFRCFWLVATDGVVDMCLKHPGFDVDLLVEADLRTFVEAWRGFRDLEAEIRARRIRVTGPRDLKRALPGWLLLSSLSPYPRQREGRERQLGGLSSVN